MTNKGIKEIISLNREFYEKHNESFDKSRSYGFWEGFEEILEYLPKTPKILDLGCGNARFLKFLLEKNLLIFSYLGLDNSKEFIQKNREKYKNFDFLEKDVVTELESISEKFSVIVAFGITHHIPSKDFRKNWFQLLSKLVSKNGVLILSFWNFDKKKEDKKFQPNLYKKEDGDYFLGWKDDFSCHRFCHFYEETEIDEVISYFNEFNLLRKFDLDNNTYLILKRI